MASDLRLRENAYWRERWGEACRTYNNLSEDERKDLGSEDDVASRYPGGEVKALSK